VPSAAIQIGNGQNLGVMRLLFGGRRFAERRERRRGRQPGGGLDWATITCGGACPPASDNPVSPGPRRSPDRSCWLGKFPRSGRAGSHFALAPGWPSHLQATTRMSMVVPAALNHQHTQTPQGFAHSPLRQGKGLTAATSLQWWRVDGGRAGIEMTAWHLKPPGACKLAAETSVPTLRTTGTARRLRASGIEEAFRSLHPGQRAAWTTAGPPAWASAAACDGRPIEPTARLSSAPPNSTLGEPAPTKEQPHNSQVLPAPH
jgi:hypothetical protein